ncbi:MAG: dihydrofolate reductase family protein [Cyclobacteriaceae bacterium]|nr:dihydrofolate reductase family protein [Cyclobacteriaceae bacterium]MCO5271790.1 dihydrofolate reductase family protein [Cyclobacteriaceae bacterium]
MRKVIAAINMTLDGYCDHNAIIPDEEIHQHYTDLLDNAEIILYGRNTFELMKFWQTLIEKPSGEKSMDDFARSIDKIKKTLFSHSMKNTGWDSAELAKEPLDKTVISLKQKPGNGILVGSRSLIIQLLNLHLVDELQLCVHPVIAGGGLPLFDNIEKRTGLKLKNTKTFKGGAVLLYYGPADPGTTKH